MKQVAYLPNGGKVVVMDVPAPILQPNGILVQTAVSLISAGTERALIRFGQQSLIQKARARPDLVRRTLDKARRDGIVPALTTARERLDRWSPLGYSAAGTVVAVGSDAPGFNVGDRVACAGSGYANHAEFIYVPRRLAVPLPESVSFESGAFATFGAIALQGIRQAEVTIGQDVAVIGLGVIGQLAAQLLKAAGCRVFGVEPNPKRAALAMALGVDALCSPDAAMERGMSFTAGRGFDAVVLCVDSRRADAVTLAGQLARDRAIVVALGAIKLNVPRQLFYDKELDLRLSRSYGPGRYDANYEERGNDYPIGFVRFTEERNLETFVRMAANRTINVEPLISHRIPIGGAPDAYQLILDPTRESLGVLLTYPQVVATPISSVVAKTNAPDRQATIRLGVVGAGNFANATLLPVLHKVKGIVPVGIVSASGLSARQATERFGFAYCASDFSDLLADSTINCIAILTRHNLHAAQAIAALNAGKDVFVEKPLALNRAELLDVIRVQRQSGKRLMVGFNRRFAPLIRTMRDFRPADQPITALYRVNAGALPANHWVRQPEIGGGRVISEVCHFIDLLQYLVDAPLKTLYASATNNPDEELALTLTFADNSVGSILYATGGDSTSGKERIEFFGGGRTAILDDFRHLDLYSTAKHLRKRGRPDKGHCAEWEALLSTVQSGQSAPIPIESIVTTHLATFAAIESSRSGRPIDMKAQVDAFWLEAAEIQFPLPG